MQELFNHNPVPIPYIKHLSNSTGIGNIIALRKMLFVLFMEQV